MPSAVAPVRSRRPCPSREEVLADRAARERRQMLLLVSIVCGTLAGAVHGIANPAPYWAPQLTPSLLALLIPGVGLGLLAGPRTWPAHILSAIIGVSTLSFIAPGMGLGLTLTSVSVLALGYAGLCLWALVIHGRLSFPLRRDLDAPRSGGGFLRDGPPKMRLREPSATNAAPPDKSIRIRWFQ